MVRGLRVWAATIGFTYRDGVNCRLRVGAVLLLARWGVNEELSPFVEDGGVDVLVLSEVCPHEHVLGSKGGGVVCFFGGLLSSGGGGQVGGDEEALGVGDRDFAGDGGGLLLGDDPVDAFFERGLAGGEAVLVLRRDHLEGEAAVEHALVGDGGEDVVEGGLVGEDRLHDVLVPHLGDGEPVASAFAVGVGEGLLRRLVDLAVIDIVDSPVVGMADGREGDDVLLVLRVRREEWLQQRRVGALELWAVGEVVPAILGGIVDAEKDGVTLADSLRLDEGFHEAIDAVAGAAEEHVGARGGGVGLVFEDSVDAGELRPEGTAKWGGPDDEGEGRVMLPVCEEVHLGLGGAVGKIALCRFGVVRVRFLQRAVTVLGSGGEGA